MAEATTYQFSHKEMVEALIKKQGLHEGIWSLTVEFGFGVANTGTGKDDLNPAAIIPLLKVGIMKSKELTSLSVDASVVNPAQGKTSSVQPKLSPPKKALRPRKKDKS